MFLSLLLTILLIVVIGIVILWVSRLPWALAFDPGTGLVYDIEPGVAFLAIILFGGFMALAWFTLIKIATFPSRFRKSRQAAKAKTAHQYLVEGILAAEAGQLALAKKLSVKAADHATDNALKHLLAARTAEIDTDWLSAERAWNRLAEQPAGQLAGLRGAITAARERGDTRSVENYARKALEHDSGAVWAFNALFDSQIANGGWSASAITLTNNGKSGQLDGRRLQRRRAVVCTAQAVCLPEHEGKKALTLLEEAVRLAPDFPPAIWHLAHQLMKNERHKAAQDVLEKGWSARPHAALAQMVRRIGFEMPTSALLHHLQALIDANSDHRESLILQAELGMLQKNWPEAMKILTRLADQQTSSRLCLLLERALIGYGDPDEAERWARMAMIAAHEPEWSDIEPNGMAFMYDQADWSRLVYIFGDEGRLIHPRHDGGKNILDAGRFLARQPQQTPAHMPPEQSRITAPLDYEMIENVGDMHGTDNQKKSE